jgi:hypothetical protein
MKEMNFTPAEINSLAQMFVDGEISQEDVDILKEVMGIELPSPLPAPSAPPQPVEAAPLPAALSAPPQPVEAAPLPQQVVHELLDDDDEDDNDEAPLPVIPTPTQWLHDLTEDDVCIYTLMEE